MLTAQIKSVLSDLNKWIPGSYIENADLMMNEVAYIILNSDECLYPDSRMSRYHFDTVNGLLYVYEGYVDKDGLFIKRNRPQSVIDFDLINAIVMASQLHGKLPYLYGRQA